MPDSVADTLIPTPHVPGTIEEALDPNWLSAALSGLSNGAPVESVELAEVITTMASKVRFVVRFAGDPTPHRFCIKAFLGQQDGMAGGMTTIRESDFYTRIAPRLTMRLPKVPAAVLDREGQRGIIIMDDLIAAGARFCSALEPFTPALAEQSLDQLARLHANPALATEFDWLPARIEWIAEKPHYEKEFLQSLLDDERGEGMDARTRDAGLMLEGMKRLAERNRSKPLTLLHGDCHAGNLFLIDGAPGFTDWQLVQRGHWALDVAYHIAAVFPVEVAEREERALLDHYSDRVRAHGGTMPPREEAWEDYRVAQIYGYYHWAITRFSPMEIIRTFVQRLGAGVARHESYKLLNL